MKDLIKNAKIYAIPIVFCLFLVGGIINKCSKPAPLPPYDLRGYLMDSIQQADIMINIAEIEYVKDSLGDIAEVYKLEAIELRKALKKQRQKSDALVEVVPRTDTVCWDAINSKQAEIDTLNVIADKLDLEAITYSRQLFLCETQGELKGGLIESKSIVIAKLNGDIDVLRKSNKRNWWERNKLWIGVVGGVVGGGLVMKSPLTP